MQDENMQQNGGGNMPVEPPKRETFTAKERKYYKLDFLSMILAFILIILFVASGVYLTATGHDTVGGIIFSTTIIGVAGLFITGAYNKTQNPN